MTDDIRLTFPAFEVAFLIQTILSLLWIPVSSLIPDMYGSLNTDITGIAVLI